MLFFWVGLWHGAGWNFILFGLLHGGYIVIYNIWQKIKNKFPKVKIIKKAFISDLIAQIITFLAVTLAFVFFRAESMNGAINILHSMVGAKGISLPSSMADNIGILFSWFTKYGVLVFDDGMFRNNVFGHSPLEGFVWIVILFIITLLMPNTQQIMRSYNPKFEVWTGKILKPAIKWLEWKPNLYWGIFVTAMLVISIINISKYSEFLYFQF